MSGSHVDDSKSSGGLDKSANIKNGAYVFPSVFSPFPFVESGYTDEDGDAVSFTFPTLLHYLYAQGFALKSDVPEIKCELVELSIETEVGATRDDIDSDARGKIHVNNIRYIATPIADWPVETRKQIFKKALRLQADQNVFYC